MRLRPILHPRNRYAARRPSRARAALVHSRAGWLVAEGLSVVAPPPRGAQAQKSSARRGRLNPSTIQFCLGERSSGAEKRSSSQISNSAILLNFHCAKPSGPPRGRVKKGRARRRSRRAPSDAPRRGRDPSKARPRRPRGRPSQWSVAHPPGGKRVPVLDPPDLHEGICPRASPGGQGIRGGGLRGSGVPGRQLREWGRIRDARLGRRAPGSARSGRLSLDTKS